MIAPPAIASPAAPPRSVDRSRRRVFWAVVVLFGLVLSLGFLAWWRQTYSPDTSFARGMQAHSRQDVAAMYREVKILQGYPRFEPHRQFLRGAIALAGDDPAGALPLFDQSVLHPQTRVPSLILAGEAFCKLGRQDEAIGVLEQALQQEPENGDALRWLAVAAHDLGDRDRALTTLRKARDLQPDDYRIHRLLGTFHRQSGRLEEAVQDDRAVLRLSPTPEIRQHVLVILAQTLLKLGRLKEAARFLDEAQPDADVWACRAAIAYQEQRPDAARSAAREVLAQIPNHRDALLLMATLEKETGRPLKSAEYLERVVKAWPQDDLGPAALAVVYDQLGRPEEARLQREAAKEIQNRRKRMSELLQQARETPKDVQIRFELAQVAEQLGFPRLARRWYQGTLALNPQHRRASQALQELNKKHPVRSSVADTPFESLTSVSETPW